MAWRPELAAGIFAHLERIDLLEVVADDYFHAPARKVRSLQTLAAQLPVVLHGVSMGLASCERVTQARLDHMARLVEQVRPESWSEHLAFVRAGGIEIGHLAAPPRTAATVQGAADNLARAGAAVGIRPQVENIATLIDPPASRASEWEWIQQILADSSCDLLLDLHNLYANGVNHGYDQRRALREIPPAKIGVVHLGGGTWIPAPDGGARVLDDHLHDVPDTVFELLEETAALAIRPLTVILERDGRYPSMEQLLKQMDGAREAMARGRARTAIRAVAPA